MTYLPAILKHRHALNTIAVGLNQFLERCCCALFYDSFKLLFTFLSMHIKHQTQQYFAMTNIMKGAGPFKNSDAL